MVVEYGYDRKCRIFQLELSPCGAILFCVCGQPKGLFLSLERRMKMTRQEKRDRAKWFCCSTTVYAYGVIATILLFCVLLRPLIIFLGMGTCLILFFLSNTIFTGGKLMRNPFQILKEVKEKQDALIKHLKLKAELIPQHWIFKALKAKD